MIDLGAVAVSLFKSSSVQLKYLFILHNKLFDNQGSEINKSDNFFTFRNTVFYENLLATSIIFFITTTFFLNFLSLSPSLSLSPYIYIYIYIYIYTSYRNYEKKRHFFSITLRNLRQTDVVFCSDIFSLFCCELSVILSDLLKILEVIFFQYLNAVVV